MLYSSYGLYDGRTAGAQAREGVIAMVVTATELKQNLGHYLNLAEHEPVQVTKNGRLTVQLAPADEVADADEDTADDPYEGLGFGHYWAKRFAGAGEDFVLPSREDEMPRIPVFE